MGSDDIDVFGVVRHSSGSPLPLGSAYPVIYKGYL